MRFQSLVVIITILLILFCSGNGVASKEQSPHAATANKTTNATKHQKTHDTGENQSVKIESLVMMSQPKRGQSYAHHISQAICRESKLNNVPALAIATTGYIESEFNRNAGPCVGIMQVHPPTYREMCRKTDHDLRDADLDNLDDNIRVGTREFSRYYHMPLASRSGESWRLSYTWGRYNGCGPGGSYVDRARSVYTKLKTKSPDELKLMIKRRPLWRD